MPRTRQEVNLVLVTEGDLTPLDVLKEALAADSRVVGVEDTYGYTTQVLPEPPEPDKARLRNLAAWAAGEDAKRRLGLPNEWVQANYFTRAAEDNPYGLPEGCGTACCIAGKVAVEDGGEPYWGFGGDSNWSSQMVFPGSDELVLASHHAREALGLTEGQADRLFHGYNTLDDVLRIIADLTGDELQD